MVIEERRSHFQRDGHAGPIDFGQNVIGQVGLHIDILNAREEVVGGGVVVMLLEDADGVVSSHLIQKILGEQAALFMGTEDAHGVEISFEGRAGEALKGGFATKNAWGPGEGGIQASQGSKDSAAKGRRNETAQVIFELVEVVTAVACKQLIGAVATQSHSDLFAGDAGNIVGGNGGGVGKRLIVVPG